MNNVGLIGLGLMGMPMAQNLISAGYSVYGFRRGDMSAFKDIGGIPSISPRDVAERADIILCCIPNEEALSEIVSGPSGLITGSCADKILVELSTLSLTHKRNQAEAFENKGGTMLDGAISGLPSMVAAKSAIYFISGQTQAFELSQDILKTVTDKLHFMGKFGNASHAKLCANMLVAINIASTAETLAFGSKLGLDPQALVEALRESAAASLQFTARAGRMVSGDWNTVHGATSVLTKDVHLIENAATEAKCPVPILNSVAQLYDAAMVDGQGDKDVAAIYATIAKAAGLAFSEKR